ncbi:MAG: family 1 glycosylhydrolase, partial [Candidatus Dormibacteraeota bacterium]|nr:family 1 glycosylhydrolase [Candidatus Dormibacteraeota bacterium]
NGETGDIADDHYHRLEEDLDLMARLGLRAYRFSVAWPRVQPDGRGAPNQAGLDFYRRLVEGLRRRNIVPALTLYHWDLPQPLEDAGGWPVRDTAERFAEYAGIVARALGDSVGLWITVNEPWVAAWIGYGTGRHAPGRADIGDALAATHHLLLGHGLAVQQLRSALNAEARVGITLNLNPVHVHGDSEADRAAQRRVDGNQNRLFLDPLFKGHYPADMLEHYAERKPGLFMQAGDLEVISQPTDFLGINYYSPKNVIARQSLRDGVAPAGYAYRAGQRGASAAQDRALSDDLGAADVWPLQYETTPMGWTIEPDAFHELLVWVHREYGPRPLYVTENGMAVDDYADPDGRVVDRRRIAYLDGHLRAARRAIADGADLRGYFVWSLLDNFEWALGYSKRFGIVYVDYPTQRRTPKASFDWYRQVIARNGLPAS